jgi:hypothetical protein
MNRTYLPIPGVILVIATALVGGVIGGIVMVITARGTHYAILPAGVGGFAAVIIFSLAIWYGKVKDPLINGLLALVMSIVVYGTYQFVEYMDFRQTLSNDIRADLGDLDQETTDLIIEEYFIDETGSSGFIGYVRHLLKYGYIVSRIGRPDRQTGTSETIFNLLLDFGLILVVSVLAALMANGRAFCDHCKRYYGRMSISWTAGMEILGRVGRDAADDFLNHIKSNQYAQARKLIQRKQFFTPCLEIQIERCKTCDVTPIMLTAMRTGGVLSSRRDAVLQQIISPEQYRQLANKL